MAKIKVKSIYEGLVNYEGELYFKGDELVIEENYFKDDLFVKLEEEKSKRVAKKKEEE